MLSITSGTITCTNSSATFSQAHRNDQASTDAEQVQLPPKTPRSAPRHAPRGPKQKGFCRKWVTFGCCKFGPDCFNRHGMPETLIELKAIGLHNWPGWFRYKNPDLFEATKPAQSPAKIGKYTVTAPTFSAAEHGKHLFVEDANTKRENAVSVTDGKHENCACGQHNVASVSPATSTGSRSHQALTMATKASSVETPRAASLKQPQSLPEQSYQKSAPAIDLSNHQKPTSMHSPNHAVARQNPNQVLQNVLPTTANPAQVSLTLLPQHHRGPNRGCAGRQFYRTRKPKRIDVMRRLGNASLSEASPAINEAERDEKRESQESKIGSRGGHRSDGSISCQMRVHEHETTDGVVQEI